MARITLTIDETVVVLETGRGRSAYQSYLATTDDDPVLTEEQWAMPATAGGSLNLADHFGILENPDVIIDGGLL
jgi:hypothetical protein